MVPNIWVLFWGKGAVETKSRGVPNVSPSSLNELNPQTVATVCGFPSIYETECSWSTSTWLALQAQRLSVAVHIASAWEIATEMQLAGGGGEAPYSDEEGAATA
jgi:hypothetical protein